MDKRVSNETTQCCTKQTVSVEIYNANCNNILTVDNCGKYEHRTQIQIQFY